MIFLVSFKSEENAKQRNPSVSAPIISPDLRQGLGKFSDKLAKIEIFSTLHII